MLLACFICGFVAMQLCLVPELRFSLSAHVQQVAQLSQRDRDAWWVSFGQKWRQYVADIIGLSSTTVT